MRFSRRYRADSQKVAKVIDMRTTLILILPIVFLATACLAQDTKKNAVEHQIPFQYSIEEFGEARIRTVAKTRVDETVDGSFPIDAPAHTCFHLEAKRLLPALERGSRYFHPAYSFICIVPTFDPTEDDFAAAYPNFSKAVELIRKLVNEKPEHFRQFKDVFDFPYNNAGWSIRAKEEYLSYSNINGVLFVTQYSQELLPNPLNNEELTANFQGLTQDGKYYVGARFSVIHDELPTGIDFVEGSIREKCLEYKYPEINDCVGEYLDSESERLQKFRDEEFKPSLNTIKTLISTISPK